MPQHEPAVLSGSVGPARAAIRAPGEKQHVGSHLPAALGFLLAACTSNPVSVETIPPAAGALALRASALDGRLSLASLDLLHDLAAEHLRDAPPEQVVRELGAGAARDCRGALLLAELLLLGAERQDRDGAAACFLEAALAAIDALSAPAPALALDADRALLAQLYAHALASLLAVQGSGAPPARWGNVRGIGRELTVDATAAEGAWPADFFDWLRPAVTIESRGLRTRHLRTGLGVPLVARRAHATALRAGERFYPPEGLTCPATLLVWPEGEATLRAVLLDPRRATTFAVLGQRFPVAADLSTPYAWLLAGAPLHQLADATFFDADAETRHRGVYLLEPYDPGRTPVVFIHGLWSSPLAWRELTNELWGDADLARRYQVWHYVYPTAAPLLNNARDMRAALAEVRAALDPDGNDRASKDIVLVGHSMGGILAKAMVQDSGDALWQARFTRPLDSLDLSVEARRYAQDTFFFAPLGYVSRVIFLGAPHRGSLEADSFVGRLGSWLQGRTKRVRDFAREVEERNHGAMREGTLATPSSVDVLSPAHVVLGALAALPIAEGVRWHTIVGDVTGRGAPDAHDGVVAYASSRIEGAESELVIDGAGHDLQLHPRAIAEVRRILAAHRAER